MFVGSYWYYQVQQEEQKVTQETLVKMIKERLGTLRQGRPNNNTNSTQLPASTDTNTNSNDTVLPTSAASSTLPTFEQPNTLNHEPLIISQEEAEQWRQEWKQVLHEKIDDEPPLLPNGPLAEVSHEREHVSLHPHHHLELADDSLSDAPVVILPGVVVNEETGDALIVVVVEKDTHEEHDGTTVAITTATSNSAEPDVIDIQTQVIVVDEEGETRVIEADEAKVPVPEVVSEVLNELASQPTNQQVNAAVEGVVNDEQLLQAVLAEVDRQLQEEADRVNEQQQPAESPQLELEQQQQEEQVERAQLDLEQQLQLQQLQEQEERARREREVLEERDRVSRAQEELEETQRRLAETKRGEEDAKQAESMSY
jgi:hypothetical protein